MLYGKDKIQAILKVILYLLIKNRFSGFKKTCPIDIVPYQWNLVKEIGKRFIKKHTY